MGSQQEPMVGLSNEPIPDRRLSQTEGLQICWHRFNLSISCGVVEQPDHHFGDDLVIRLSQIVNGNIHS